MLLAVLGTLVALAGYKLIAMSSAFAVDSVRVTGAPPALERKIHAAVEQAGARPQPAVGRPRRHRRIAQRHALRPLGVG